MPELNVSSEKVCFMVMRARGIATKEAGPGLGEGSNPSDQGIEDEVADLDVLDASLPDLTEEELRDAIVSLNQDEQLELIALMRLGRDDTATPDDWDEILEQVAASQETPARELSARHAAAGGVPRGGPGQARHQLCRSGAGRHEPEPVAPGRIDR